MSIVPAEAPPIWIAGRRVYDPAYFLRVPEQPQGASIQTEFPRHRNEYLYWVLKWSLDRVQPITVRWGSDDDYVQASFTAQLLDDAPEWREGDRCGVAHVLVALTNGELRSVETPGERDALRRAQMSTGSERDYRPSFASEPGYLLAPPRRESAAQRKRRKARQRSRREVTRSVDAVLGTGEERR